MKNIGIMGAGGFTGRELLSILKNHTFVKVVYITSNAYKGQKLKDIFAELDHPQLKNLIFEEHPKSIDDLSQRDEKIDLMFLATPDLVSLEWAKKLLDANIKVIDLGGTYRLNNTSDYPEYYGFEHEQPNLLEQAIYGMCEINRQKIMNSNFIANPGCYTTAAILPMVYLCKALKKVYPQKKFSELFYTNYIIDAKSGSSGAGGRKEKDSLGFSTVYENFRAYKVKKHQHIPEIEQQVSNFTDQDVKIRFVPHLLPVFRGILLSSYLTLNNLADVKSLDTKSISGVIKDLIKEEPFVRFYDTPEEIQLNKVQHTNFIDFSFYFDERTNVFMIISAIDNLKKGAAGSAVQNMNLMFDFNEIDSL